MNIILAAILVCNVILLSLLIVAGVKIRAVFIDVKAFITPPGENQPSPAAQVGEVLSDMFARSLVAQAKATFMGLQSAAVRGEGAIDGDLAEGSLQLANPAIAALLNSFPALKKTLRRNPGLVDLALSKLVGKFGNNPVAATSNNGDNGSQVKFKL